MEYAWDDIKKYKNCQKKQYTIHVCMPPKNTVVINKLEQADVVRQLDVRTSATVDDLEEFFEDRCFP